MNQAKQEEKPLRQTVAVEDAGSCRKLLKVEVEAAEVTDSVEKTIKEFQKLARIPGFRPGHAPRAMIEKRFAKEIEGEVQRQTIPVSYRQAINAHKLHVVTMPQIDKVEFARGQPLKYEAKLEVAPDFPLPQYKGIPVKKKTAEVTEEDVDKVLDTLREQRAEFADVAGRPAAMGDFAVIRYSAVVEGKPIHEVAPKAGLPEADKDFWLMMNEQAMAPGFCQQVVGANVGDRKQVLVDYPGDFFAPELQGRKATFFVELKGIKEKKLPALDDAFAESIKLKDLASLKAKVREDLTKQKQADAGNDVRNQIMENLMRSTQFELPPGMLAHETREVVYDVVRENMMRGITKEAIDAKKDEIFGFASKSAADHVRASFILSRIAQEEQIKVEKKEVDDRVAQMAQRYQIPLQKLRERLDERGGIFEIEEQILRSKTLDFLEANARVEPV